MDYRVEKLDPNDLDKFFKLFEKSLKTQFPEYTKNTIRFFLKVDYRKELLKSSLEREFRIILVAKDSNQNIVGYLLASKPYGGVGFCNWIAVDSDFQEKGIASALLAKWEQLAKELGAHVIHLWAAEHNLKFYQNRGYVLVGKVPHNFYGSEDYLFYKEIQEPKESNFLREFLNKKRS